MYIKKILYIFLCCSLPYCNGQIQSFTQVIPSVDCDSSSFFNSANLQCETCSDYISNSQPINGTISKCTVFILLVMCLWIIIIKNYKNVLNIFLKFTLISKYLSGYLTYVI